MKYNKYLIITLLIFISLVTTFFYTKNIFYFYLTIPILIYACIIRYFQDKNKLLIKTNKILNLLKYESILYAISVIIAYSMPFVSFTNKINKVEYYYTVGYTISVIFLILTGVIHIKRTLLIRKELRNNNSKWQKKEISSLSNWFLNFSCTKIFIKWIFYIFYSYYTY